MSNAIGTFARQQTSDRLADDLENDDLDLLGAGYDTGSVSHIVGSLYIGDLTAAEAWNAEFSCVINCQHRDYTCSADLFKLEVPRYRGSQREFIRFGDNLSRLFLFLRQYDPEDDKILVHCRAGKHRAPAVAALIMHHMLGYDMSAAKRFISESRPIVEFWRVDYLLNGSRFRV